MIRVTNPFHITAVSISRQTSEYNGDKTASRKRGRRTHSTLPINQNCASNVNLNFISVVLNGKKITLVIQLSSFIQKVVDERGVRILAITLAFQAREAGSIPARRSNFSPFWVVDCYYQRAFERTLFFNCQIKSYGT